MDAITQTINDYFAAIRALNLAAWLSTFAADGVSHEPGHPPLAGREALAAFFNGVAAGFDAIDMTPDQIFVAGNEAAVKWSARGTGKNGRAVTFEGIDIFTLNDEGRIQTLKAYWNPAAMMADLIG